ncbi:MAG TPA: ABC transporter substrate-binding protein [Methylomirabilota bacterium]
MKVLLAVGILLAPAEARGQSKVPRVGYVNLVDIPILLEAFRDGLRDLGWRDGDNLVVEAHSADGRVERARELAAEMVRRKVDVVLLTATSIRAVKPVIGTIPGVFVIADDPVSAGLVSSLARPGGHLTGLTSLNIDLDIKRLEILKSALPGRSRVALFVTPADPTFRDRVVLVERAAQSLGIQLQIIEVSTTRQLPAAFDAAARGRAGAVMVLGSPQFFPEQKRIAELAAAARVPVISAWREFADAGGLMSYGTNVPAMFRRAASYVDRILKGANPADLPVEQANTFELVVNVRTAKALDLVIPAAVLLRADHVVQ